VNPLADSPDLTRIIHVNDDCALRWRKDRSLLSSQAGSRLLLARYCTIIAGFPTTPAALRDASRPY